MKASIQRRLKFVALPLLIGLLLLGWFVTGSGGDQSELTWLSQPPLPRPVRLAFLGRWMGPVKLRLQRVKYWLLGPPRSVSLSGTILEIEAAAALSNFPPVALAFTNPSGGKVFVVKDGKALRDWAAARPRTGVLASPHITVGDGMQAQISSTESVTVGAGTNLTRQWIGRWLDVWPRVRGQAVDLTCFLTCSERVPLTAAADDGLRTNGFFIRTNAAFGVRALIPERGSVFIISGRTNEQGRVIGAVLSPSVPPRPGR